MSQLTLDHALARTTDPATSQQAAAAQTPAKLSTGRRLALETLAERGPLTDFELAEHTGKAQTSIGCRRKDLVRLGYAVDSGDTRPSPSGSAAIVWQLTADGYAAYLLARAES